MAASRERKWGVIVYGSARRLISAADAVGELVASRISAWRWMIAEARAVSVLRLAAHRILRERLRHVGSQVRMDGSTTARSMPSVRRVCRSRRLTMPAARYCQCFVKMRSEMLAKFGCFGYFYLRLMFMDRERRRLPRAILAPQGACFRPIAPFSEEHT